MHADDVDLVDLANGLILAGAGQMDREFRMRHADGHWIWIRARAEVVPDAEDEPHLVGIAVDVTEQKRLAEASRTADLRLRDAFEAISEAFVLWDAANRLVMCNSKYQQLYGLPDDLVQPGTPYAEIARSGRRPAIAAQRPARRRRRRRPLGGGARRGRPLAADQRAADQRRRLRLGRHRHHGAQAERSAASGERARADRDRRRPPALAPAAGEAGAAARRARREIRGGEGEGGGRQPHQVGVPRQRLARAQDAAQRHHRLLGDDAVGRLRPARRRQIRRILPRHPARAAASCSASSPTSSTWRGWRPAASRSTASRSTSMRS